MSTQRGLIALIAAQAVEELDTVGLTLHLEDVAGAPA